MIMQNASVYYGSIMILLEKIDNLISGSVLIEKKLKDVSWEDVESKATFDYVQPKKEDVEQMFRDTDLRDLDPEVIKEWPKFKSWMISREALKHTSTLRNINDHIIVREKGVEPFKEWLLGPGKEYLDKSGVSIDDAIGDKGKIHKDLDEAMKSDSVAPTSLVVKGMWGSPWGAPAGYSDFLDYLVKRGYISKKNSYSDNDVESFIKRHATYGEAELSQFKHKELKELQIFDEVVNKKAKEAFSNAKSYLYNAMTRGGRVKIYRAIQVEMDQAGYMNNYEGWLEHLADSGKSLGVFWTDKKEKAHSYWGGGAGKTAVIEATAPNKGVDWISSIIQRMNPTTRKEQEVRLHKGVPINIENIWIEGNRVDLPEKIKRKTFQA